MNILIDIRDFFMIFMILFPEQGYYFPFLIIKMMF